MKNFEKKLYVSLLSGLFSVLVFDTAVAQVQLQFSDGTTTGPTGTTFNFDVGTTQTISVVAVDTMGTDNLATTGLTTFGFAVDATATPDAASTLVDFTHAAPFSPVTNVTTPSSADVAGFALFPAAGASQSLGDFEVSVTEPGTTVFTFSDLTGTTDFGSGLIDLDPIIFGESVSFTINGIAATVPEPSGSALIGLSMLATMIRRKRNRS